MKNNNMQIVNNVLFGEVRLLVEDNKVYFCGKDIAAALGYGNTNDAVLRHCNRIIKHSVTDRRGRPQRNNFISEGDVCRLIIKSRLDSASEFERWLFDEVLPTIRIMGGYVNDVEAFVDSYFSDANDELKVQVLNILSDCKNNAGKLVRMVELSGMAMASLDAFKDEGSITISEFAKSLHNEHQIDIGTGRLCKWLRENGYFMTKSDFPLQRWINAGWFEVRIHRIEATDYPTRRTYITVKGQKALFPEIERVFGKENVEH